MRLVPRCGFVFALVLCLVVAGSALTSALANASPPLDETMFIQALPALEGGASSYSVTLDVSKPSSTLPVQEEAFDDKSPVLRTQSTSDAGNLFGRVAVFPYGTESVTITGVQVNDSDQPVDLVQAGALMKMRGIPVMPISVDMPALQAAAGSEASALRLSFDVVGTSLTVPFSGDNAVVRFLRGQALNPDGSTPTHRGCYLIITATELQAELTPLIEWKTREGYEVRLVTTGETGITRNEIKAYIANAYETWESPPLFLLLVGDADGSVGIVPTWTLSGTVSDHLYTAVDGDDFLPDMFVGRLPAKYAGEVALQVLKTVNYLSQPVIDDVPWQSKALLVARNYNSTTPIPLNRWARGELMGYGYATVDTVFDVGDTPYTTQELISMPVNEGVSFINYRGWAHGIDGWEVVGSPAGGPTFYIDSDVRELSNGMRLPVVFSIVCHTGDFHDPARDCFGEAWVKGGTLEAPSGAVAFVGTGEDWSHSRWNDRFDMGVMKAICNVGVHQMSPIMAFAKLSLFEHYPTEIWMEDAYEDPEEAVEYYMNTYNLLGDPSLTLWTGQPEMMTVTLDQAEVEAGANYLTISLANSAARPVAGAHVSIVQDDQLVGYATSDPAGIASLSFSLNSLEPVTITATGDNLYPWSAVYDVVTPATALSFDTMTASGTSHLPGTDISVQLSFRNSGSADISSASVEVTSAGIGMVVEGAAAVGAIDAGQSAAALDDVTVRFDDLYTADGARARFLATPTVGGTALTPTEFWLTASAPAFDCTATSDGLDGLYNPGEEVNLLVTLTNKGSTAAGAITATLRNLAPASAAFVDSSCVFDEILPEASGSNDTDALVIKINDTTPIGTIIPLELTATSADGPITTTVVNLVVGQVDFSTTIGPDAYGYYCYDSADIDYPAQAPVYDWIEISETYGGPGTELTRIGDNRRAQNITMPFTFNYYGRPYTELRISDNGWISFDLEYWLDVRNYSMPDYWGCSCHIAAFWDNLDPSRDDTDGIYYWYDEANSQLIIEWSRLRNFQTSTTDDFQTFQIILRDVEAAGDDEIIFQYKQIVNDDWERTYSTVGIEDHTEEVGITYSYDNHYIPGAAPLSSGLAIRFTTEAPTYQPLVASLFTARYSAGSITAPAKSDNGSVDLSWELSDSRPIAGLELYRSIANDSNWSSETKITQNQLAANAVDYLDETADPNQRYRYRLVAIDALEQARTLGEAVYNRISSSDPFVALAGGTVLDGEAVIRFSAGQSELTGLAVYDATGRRVSDLFAQVSVGQNQVSWAGRDDAGRQLPSGLYWIRLSTKLMDRKTKIVIIR